MTNGTPTALQSGAAAAEKVVETIASVEPTIATIAGMFIPGAAPIVAAVQPFVLLGIPYLERAINDIATGNGGDFMGAMIEVMQHLSRGQPNSPILSGPTPAINP
jgi:cobalamin synthase